MSVEFIRGPNVYLRETVVGDLTNIKDSLVDWNWFPYSLDETKGVLRGSLISMRSIERPYTNTSHFTETFTVCKVSDNSFVGITQYQVRAGKVVTITYNAALPALRGGDLMNEAAKLRDAALFTELSAASYINRLDPSFISTLRAYQTLEGTELSQRSNRTLKIVKAVKADYDTWRTENASSVPSYTFSGASYTPPQSR